MLNKNLLVVTSFWPDQRNPITGIFVVQQIAALSETHNVTVIVCRSWSKSALLLDTGRLGLREDRVRILIASALTLPGRLSILPKLHSLNAWMTGKAIRRVLSAGCGQLSFDACIIHGLSYAGFSLPTWSHLVSGGKAIVVHGIDPSLRAGQDSVRSVMQASAKVAASIVLVGQVLRDYVLSLGAPPGKVLIIPNGTVAPDSREVSCRQRPITVRRRVVSVSNLIHCKGIDLNLQALARLARSNPEVCWEYRVIGDGPQRQHLEQLVEELGISDRVTFLGRLPYDLTMNEIAEADIFSLPSREEAFGIVYLEAMARMRPVIGCYGTGAEETVVDGQNGLLVNTKDVASLSDALERLLFDPGLSEFLGSKGRATAINFSWTLNAERTVSATHLKFSDVARVGEVET